MRKLKVRPDTHAVVMVADGFPVSHHKSEAAAEKRARKINRNGLGGPVKVKMLVWGMDPGIGEVEANGSWETNHLEYTYWKNGDERQDADKKLQAMGYRPVSTLHWAHTNVIISARSVSGEDVGHNEVHYTKHDDVELNHASVHTYKELKMTFISIHAHDGATPEKLK